MSAECRVQSLTVIADSQTVALAQLLLLSMSLNTTQKEKVSTLARVRGVPVEVACEALRSSQWNWTNAVELLEVGDIKPRSETSYEILTGSAF